MCVFTTVNNFVIILNIFYLNILRVIIFNFIYTKLNFSHLQVKSKKVFSVGIERNLEPSLMLPLIEKVLTRKFLCVLK